MDPTPSAPAAPATPAAYDGDSLRAELGSAGAALGLKDVGSELPGESTSTGEAAPDAPASGTTPAADTPPQPGKQLAEGSTPAGDSQPAAESEAADLKRALEMAGLDPAVADGLTPEQRQHFLKFGKAFLDTNNRAGALGRKLKALERGQRTPEEILLDGDPADPADEPPLEDPEDPAAGIDEEAAPPSLSDPRVVEAVEKRVDQYAAEDADCIAVSQAYHQHGATIARIAKQDESGAWTGMLPDVDRQLTQTLEAIGYLNASLDPETQKRYNLPLLDELQAADARLRLTELRAEAAEHRARRSELVDQYRSLRSERSTLRAQYTQRRGVIRNHVTGQVSARQREADNQKALKRDTDKYRGEWKSTFDTLTSTLIPEAYRADADLKKDLWDAVKQAGLVHVEAHGTIANFSEFQTQVIKRELDRLDRHHRLRSADYGRQKLADATTPTPTGAGATAAPLPNDAVDHSDALRAQTRALFAGRRAG